jgi:tetratricopeptide (TPR) repeat protein
MERSNGKLEHDFCRSSYRNLQSGKRSDRPTSQRTYTIAMDEDNDTIFNNNDYLAIFERCEHMLDSKIETYFDVYEFTELLDNYIEQGKLNKAYTLVQIAQKQHPNNTELEFRKARIHIERNDFETAVDILKKLLRIEEDNSDYHICIGVAYTYKHDFTAAVKHFTIGITLSPENEEDNLYNIGVTFLNVDNYKLAYDYLWQAYTKYPNNFIGTLRFSVLLRTITTI